MKIVLSGVVLALFLVFYLFFQNSGVERDTSFILQTRKLANHTMVRMTRSTSWITFPCLTTSRIATRSRLELHWKVVNVRMPTAMRAPSFADYSRTFQTTLSSQVTDSPLSASTAPDPSESLAWHALFTHIAVTYNVCLMSSGWQPDIFAFKQPLHWIPTCYRAKCFERAHQANNDAQLNQEYRDWKEQRIGKLTIRTTVECALEESECQVQ